MATIIDKPDALSMSGNMRRLIVQTDSAIPVILKKGTETIVEQNYEPDPDGRVTIDLREVVDSRLHYTMNLEDDSYLQEGLVADFTVSAASQSVIFRAIRSGVEHLADTHENWLASHFLTWQPRVKDVTYHSPEWLTYYAVSGCSMRIKATFPDKSSKTISLRDLNAGQCVTFNLQYATVSRLLGNKYPSHFEAFVETGGNRLTESLYYRLTDILSEDEQWFLFENSLGGMDTFRASGVSKSNTEHGHKVAELCGAMSEYDVETQRTFEKNTGHLDTYSRRWLLDFFPSRGKYIYEDSMIRRIAVTDSDVTYISNDPPSSYTFTYRLAGISRYLNLARNLGDIPTNLSVPNLSSPDFILPPRLSEYPRLELHEGVLIPVADPNSNLWHVITVGYLKEYLGGLSPGEPETPDTKPTDFLKRSDNGRIYSSIHSCLNEIRADYPEGLTRDVTVSCVKRVTEKRDPSDPDKTFDERIFVSVLKHWNKDTVFTLTIDGAGLYTINCNSLGGLRFYRVDNVVVRNVKFSNFANMSEFVTPEEVAAIQFLGLDSSYSRNCYIENCYFSGVSLDGHLLGSYYTIITKYTDNVFIINSEFRQNAALTFKLNDTRLVSLVRNRISGRQQAGILGHPGVLSVNGALAVHIEDNDINGDTYNESLFYVNNVRYLYILRNNAYVCRGRFMEVSSNRETVLMRVESNLFRNFLTAPGYMWIKDIFQLNGDIVEMCVRNNTVLINGAYYYQMFVRALGVVGTLVNCNNLFIVTASVGVSVYEFQRLDNLVSSSNLYKNDTKEPEEGETVNQFRSMVMISTSSEEGLQITATNGRSMHFLQESGFETDSFILPKKEQVLQIEGGVQGYGLLDSVAGTYLSDPVHVPPFDIEYRQNGSSVHMGAYNGNGVAFDEGGNGFKGYSAINATEDVGYDSSFTYKSPSDNYHLLTHNTLNRSAFVRLMAVGTQDSHLSLGRYSLLRLSCVVDENGEYVSDQPFKIRIDTE